MKIGVKVGLQVLLNRQRTDNMSAAAGQHVRRGGFFENYVSENIVFRPVRDNISVERRISPVSKVPSGT